MGAEPAEAAPEAGFTLVEILVAFAVAAAATTLVLQIAGTVAGGVRRVEALRVVADEAEGVALRRLTEGPLRPGLVQGRFSDGSPWILSVADVRPGHGNGGQGGQARVPPLWLLRVSRAGPGNEPVYATLVPGRIE